MLKPGTLAAIAMLVALVIVLLPVNPGVSAQPGAEPTTFETEILEWDLRITGPNFALDDVALEEYPHGTGERIYVSSVNTLAFAEIAFFDDSDTPEQTIDVMLSEFEAASRDFTLIESGEIEGVYYALARFQVSAELAGYFYIEVAPDISENVDLVQSLYTLDADFVEQLQIASEEISVNGNAFLGETVIDVETVIAADASQQATAVAEATPARSSFAFRTTESVVDVRSPVSLDYDNDNGTLEAVFVSTEAGYGIVGYIQQQAGSPEDMLDVIFATAPIGDDAPIRLHFEGDTERVLAVYRIAIDGESTIMVIEVSSAGTDLWLVEAVAVNESAIVAELEVYQQSIAIDGEQFLAGVSGVELVEILRRNQP